MVSPTLKDTMAKANRRRAHLELVETAPAKPARKVKPKFAAARAELPPIVPKTDNQKLYLDALQAGDPQVIATGSAGTGKSFLAASHAADCLLKNTVQRVVITRPNVPASRSLGFLPGTLHEKFEPWLAPILETLKERMGAGAVECAVKNGSIEFVPLELMRGRSFDDTIVLIDEAQNLTVAEAKLLLTRVGENTQVIFNGDCTQVDHKETPGLQKIIHMAKRYMLPVTIVEFGHADIVRSGICKQWVIAFEREER